MIATRHMAGIGVSLVAVGLGLLAVGTSPPDPLTGSFSFVVVTTFVGLGLVVTGALFAVEVARDAVRRVRQSKRAEDAVAAAGGESA